MHQTSKASWQQALANAITDPREIWQILQLDEELFPEALLSHQEFKLKIPRQFIEKITPGDLQDPLLKQILPVGKELDLSEGYTRDPLAERSANIMPGLLHKYKSRVLLILTSSCSVNCRYCFRRHFDYDENRLSQKDWLKVLAYIEQDPKINEIIFSGGDPLILPDRTLAKLVEQASQIPHLKTLRIHTRLPVMIPERITESFLQWFAESRLKPIMVLHINHPNEIDLPLKNAAKKMREAGVVVLNQSVLLKDVNDSPLILKRLSEKLFFDLDVIPYYLHLLDQVQGVQHFNVSYDEAKSIHQVLCQELPGYLVPKLVREEAGKPHKTLVL